jgi:hypothetical protein
LYFLALTMQDIVKGWRMEYSSTPLRVILSGFFLSFLQGYRTVHHVLHTHYTRDNTVSQHDPCAVCQQVLLKSNCYGVGGRGLSRGEMFSNYNFCLTSELKNVIKILCVSKHLASPLFKRTELTLQSK